MVNFNGILLSLGGPEASLVFIFSSGSSLFTVAGEFFKSAAGLLERLLGGFSIGTMEPIAEVVEDNADVIKAVDVSLILGLSADKLFTGSSFVLFCFCLDSEGIDSVESLLN